MNLLRHRPAAIALLAVVCGILSIIGRSDAVYEDQVGLWDWHQEYIGKVTHAVFQTHGGGRKRVIVATEQNSIASLNLRTGEIYWRRVLAESDSISALEIAISKYAISLSGDGNILRAWNLPDGALFWETFLQPSVGSPVSLHLLPIDINNDRANDLMVLSGGVLFAVSTIDGSIIWKADLASGGYNIQEVAFSPDGKLSAIGFSDTSGLVIVDIDPRFGDVHKPKLVSPKQTCSTSELLVTNGVAVALDSEGSTLVTALILPSSNVEAVETRLGNLVPGFESGAKLLSTKLEGAIAMSLNGIVIVVSVDSSTGAVSLLEEFPDTVSISDTLDVVDGMHAVSIVEPTESNSHVREFSVRVVYSNSWKEDAVNDRVKLAPHRGSIKKVFLNSYVRTDRSYGFRALVVGEDESLSLLQQGEVVWTREDGLASIIDTCISELPLEKDGHSVGEVEHDLLDWLKGHWLKLKATLYLATVEELAAVQAIRLNSAEKTKMVRDHNGFRKLLIVLTKAGKVFALHTGDGRIVWSVLLSRLRSEYGTVPLKLLPWQIPHQHALDENPVALILGRSGLGPDAHGILSWVDLYEGEELMKPLQLNFAPKFVIPLPLTTATEQRIHLVVDDEQKVHVFPRTEESLSLFMKSKPSTYFYLVNKDDGTINGYTIKDRVHATAEGDGDGYVFDSERIWSVVFPPETEVISTVVSRRQDEIVHTQTKILGNRDALYKFLSKNLIFVATVTPKAALHIGDATPEEAGLVAYLIDTVTGRIIHRVSHPSMQGPVHAVFSENWVVYHYFNLKMYRYEMTVLEFYDQNRLRDTGALQLMLGRHNGSAPISSFSIPSIDVKTQSYFFSFSVKTMTVTSTARGITGKQLLIGTIHDQVLALDKRYFDPRRSANPTPAEREEGILPLTDSIPIQPPAYLSHGYQIAGLRGIVTVPASLESTSLVFAYGHDLFYTQTAPSRTYDSLTEEFNYALLLITIVVLLIGIVVTYVWSEHKELTEKWL
ncbi:unnamed protein product [Calypogeia fissa]